MHLGLILQMAVDGLGERRAVGALTVAQMAAGAQRAAAAFADLPGERVALVDLNSEAVPITLFGAALSGKPFVPINYRLADDQLRAIVERTAPATLVAGDGVAGRLGAIDGIDVLSRQAVLDVAGDASVAPAEIVVGDEDDIAVLLFTSGTTGEPKAAVLRHRNLASYILSTVEYGAADEQDATLVSVPPYHVAGVSAVLSSLYAGRRIVYLDAFEPHAWVDLVRSEAVTHAMVVPTMLRRILEVIEADGDGLASLRSLSYGGGPMPLPVVERAMTLLPEVDLVNAYGLTETSSTIALLGPDDHRDAFASDDPAVRARLGSVGRPLPTVELSIRDEAGEPATPGEAGEIWVRGEQVSGEYLGGDADAGWFRTRDAGTLDEAGYLYVHGRLDDVIVRGGENLSPGEIEGVLMQHPDVAGAAVVGIPDAEWGEAVVAAVVPADAAQVDVAELQEFVRARLRSTKTPERIDVRAELPFNETGKLLRRVLRDELSAPVPPPPTA